MHTWVAEDKQEGEEALRRKYRPLEGESSAHVEAQMDRANNKSKNQTKTEQREDQTRSTIVMPMSFEYISKRL
eukprot:2630096-Karenia_brevis.AAC.1